MASSPRLDDLHILSEFEDEERKALIGEFVRSYEWLSEVPRVSMFALWFSDINILRKAAGPKAYPEFSESRALLASAIPAYDIAEIWADCEQANQAPKRMVQKPSSQPEFPEQDPIEQALVRDNEE
ncbi:hypothetical protein PENSUB_3238 [Penicillium subrubescens]|uniref:Uncharacterized protein n=1 Tax=Penicillium subrubescens TaxID=1316194 RepID=A0A1Q5UFG7_9EURO|nr:hypothetical protein PENSUB_3238 [Penicillium subrubescens]